MNRKTICCLFLTITLACTAILLPNVVLEYQQHTLTEKSFIKPAAQLSIDSKYNSIIHTLQIINIDSLPLIELDDELNDEEIQKQLNEQLCILYDLGIRIPSVPNPKEQEVQVQAATKVLYFGDEHPVSACRINTEQGLIWLDSESGKIVKIMFSTKRIGNTDRAFDNLMIEWEETAHNPAQDLYAWAEYYGLSASPVISEPTELDRTEIYWINEIFFMGFLQDTNGQQVAFSFSYSHQKDLDSSETFTSFFDIGSFTEEEFKQIQAELNI